jgi:hypothetical protein
VSEHFLGVTVGFDLAENVGDLSIRADEERGALDTHHFFAIRILLLDDAEKVADGLVGVGEKGVGEIVFFFKLFLGLGFIGRDAKNDETGFLQFCICVAEPARFYGSAGRIGFGIKEQDDVLPLELLKRNIVAILIRQTKIRYLRVDVHDFI